jgi:hypothetical protein
MQPFRQHPLHSALTSLLQAARRRRDGLQCNQSCERTVEDVFAITSQLAWPPSVTKTMAFVAAARPRRMLDRCPEPGRAVTSSPPSRSRSSKPTYWPSYWPSLASGKRYVTGRAVARSIAQPCSPSHAPMRSSCRPPNDVTCSLWSQRLLACRSPIAARAERHQRPYPSGARDPGNTSTIWATLISDARSKTNLPVI